MMSAHGRDRMEAGDLSQWLTGGVSQASYDSGTCIRPANGVSTDYAHSGSHSMKMTIDTSSQESGCRQFRSLESKTGGTYYYGAWFYIPQTYKASNYWNIFQFKSNNGSTEDPFWVVELMPRSNGAIHLRLRWKEGHPGPYATSGTSSSPIYFDQTLQDVSAGRWFHIEAYLVQSGSFAGHLTIWQDGVLLWDLANINTKFSGGDERWSTNNYSDGISPNPTSVYVDDATISTQRVGP